MILRHFILLLAMLFSDLIFAQNKANSEKLSQDALQIWNDQFNVFLLSHPYPYFQTTGLNQTQDRINIRHGQNNDSQNDAKRQEYAQQINKLITSNALSLETLHILEALCFKIELDGYCDRQTLLDKQRLLYTYDLRVYLKPFDLAFQNSNEALINNFIKNMSNAKYVTESKQLPLDFETLVKSYLDEHPIPHEVLLKEHDNLLTLEDIPSSELPSKTNYYTLLTTLQKSLPGPKFWELAEFCKSNSNSNAECIKISNLLIETTYGIVTKLIGYDTKITIYKNTNQQNLLLKATAANNQFANHYGCLHDALSKNKQPNDTIDINYSRLWFIAPNEVERLRTVSQYLYEKRLSEGYTDILNPENCGLNQEQISNSSQ